VLSGWEGGRKRAKSERWLVVDGRSGWGRGRGKGKAMNPGNYYSFMGLEALVRHYKDPEILAIVCNGHILAAPSLSFGSVVSVSCASRVQGLVGPTLVGLEHLKINVIVRALRIPFSPRVGPPETMPREYAPARAQPRYRV